jgi:hypothetical protein
MISANYLSVEYQLKERSKRSELLSLDVAVHIVSLNSSTTPLAVRKTVGKRITGLSPKRNLEPGEMPSNNLTSVGQFPIRKFCSSIKRVTELDTENQWQVTTVHLCCWGIEPVKPAWP